MCLLVIRDSHISVSGAMIPMAAVKIIERKTILTIQNFFFKFKMNFFFSPLFS